MSSVMQAHRVRYIVCSKEFQNVVGVFRTNELALINYLFATL